MSGPRRGPVNVPGGSLPLSGTAEEMIPALRRRLQAQQALAAEAAERAKNGGDGEAAPEVAPVLPPPGFRVVTVLVDELTCGISITSVGEIQRVGEITPLPRADESVRGLTNVRGRVMPVIDLSSCLGRGSARISPSSRLVVVEVGRYLVALLVDRALQVARIEAVPREEGTAPHLPELLTQVAHTEEQTIWVLDPERLVVARRGEASA